MPTRAELHWHAEQLETIAQALEAGNSPLIRRLIGRYLDTRPSGYAISNGQRPAQVIYTELQRAGDESTLSLRHAINAALVVLGQVMTGKPADDAATRLRAAAAAMRPQVGDPDGEQTEPNEFPNVQFSDDCHSVNWHGESMTFSTAQAVAMRRLVETLGTGLALHQTTILKVDELTGENLVGDAELRQVFRNHPAWGRLILSATGPGSKGKYLLANPSNPLPPIEQPAKSQPKSKNKGKRTKAK